MNRLGLLIWRWSDVVYRRIRRFDFQDLNGDNVLRVRVRPYQGPDFALQTGEEIKQGDWVGFLHFYNLRLQQMMSQIKSENRRGLILAKEMQRSLPMLAEFVRQHPRGERIKALVGITLVNRGVERFGFTVTELPDTWWYRFRAWYMRLMILICHPQGRKRLRQGHDLKIKRVVLPSGELFRRYGRVQQGLLVEAEQEI